MRPLCLAAASAATNFLLVAVNSAIVLVRDAMVAAWASSMSDLATADAASALKESLIWPAISSRASSYAVWVV